MARPPDAGKPRDVVVCVRFTSEQADQLDRDRGTKSRSRHIRDKTVKGR